MNRNQIAVVGLICILCNFNSATVAQEDDSIAGIIKQFDDVYFDKYEKIYDKLYKSAGADGLARLQLHSNDSIAVQATWHVVALTVPVENGDQAYEPDVAKIHAFLGFVCGRCRIAVPGWWRDVVLGCKANHRTNIYAGDPSEKPYKLSDVEDVECNLVATFSSVGDKYRYKIGQNEIILPISVLKPITTSREKLSGHITGAFTDAHLFLTVHRNLGYPREIYCIDRVTKKIIWESEVCGLHWGASSYLGDPESWAEVVPTADGRVFVFGAAPHGFYMHGFQQSDGKSIVLYSNGF